MTDTDALREALTLARPIVEVYAANADDYSDAEIYGEAQDALKAIDAALTLPQQAIDEGEVLAKLIEAQGIVACMHHRDDCTSSADHPGMCECGLTQLDRVLRLPAASKSQPSAEATVTRPAVMTAAMVNAWSGGLTFTSDEKAAHSSFQTAWKRVIAAAALSTPTAPQATDEPLRFGKRPNTGMPDHICASCDHEWPGHHDDCKHFPAQQAAGEAEAVDLWEGFTLDEAWKDLVEKDDRTSPEEYPEMCLITRDELDEYMRAAVAQYRTLATPQPTETQRIVAWLRAEIAKVNDDNSYWGGPHRQAYPDAVRIADAIEAGEHLAGEWT